MARRATGTARKAATRDSGTKGPRDYVQIAIDYATGVVDGSIVSCKLLRLRCEQFLAELGRVWDYELDKERAERACKFIECLPVPDSKDDALFRLMPWQVFVVVNLFGWINRDTGFRRFTQAHIWVAAGAGKSALASAIGLYMAFGDGQKSSEVCCVAAARKQAEVVFDSAKQMMSFRPEFRDFLGVTVNAHAIVQEESSSKFEPRSSEAKTLAGMRPYCAIVDELHVVDQAVYAFITNRLAKRDQTLLLTISTAGYDLSSLGFTIFDRSKRIIEGSIVAPEVFAVIYTADSQNITDETEWHRANPSLGVTARLNIVRSKAQEASQFSTLRHQFMTEQMNVWVNAREAWIGADEWLSRTETSLSLDGFKGRPCFIGLDASPGRSDLTAKAYVFVDNGEDGNRTYTVFFRLYLPEETVALKPDVYGGWAQDGLLDVHPGNTIDFHTITEGLLQDLTDFPGSEVCYDPAFAIQIAQELEKQGYQPIEVKQTTAELNLAMHEVLEVVKSGRLRHDGNRAAAWQIANVTVRPNAGGIVRPDKSSKDNKIDAASALFTAMRRAMVSESTGNARIGWM